MDGTLDHQQNDRGQSSFFEPPGSRMYSGIFGGDQNLGLDIDEPMFNQPRTMNASSLVSELDTDIAFPSNSIASDPYLGDSTPYPGCPGNPFSCQTDIDPLLGWSNAATSSANSNVSLQPPSSRSGSRRHVSPRTKKGSQLSHSRVQDKMIRKRPPVSSRSQLTKALNHLESVKKTLESHKHFLTMVNDLEASIMQHMVSDHRKASAKAGLRSWDADSAYKSMSQPATTEDTESLDPSFDMESMSNSVSFETTEDLQIPGSPDPMDLTTDAETPRPPRAKTVYHCVFQKVGETCTYSTNRKCDFVRHGESEEHFPQKRYMCILCIESPQRPNSICKFCSAPLDVPGNNKAHYLQCSMAQKGKHIFAGARDTHFKGHFENWHNDANFGVEQLSWTFAVQGDFPNDCGFCDEQFISWQDRMNHIVNHFKSGKNISEWRPPSGKGKGKAPRDERPRFDFKKWDDHDDDDDDGNDNHHARGSGNGHRNGCTFAPSGTTSSSQSQSSSDGSPAWTPFNYLQTSTRNLDSKIKVVDYLKDQLLAEQVLEPNMQTSEAPGCGPRDETTTPRSPATGVETEVDCDMPTSEVTDSTTTSIVPEEVRLPVRAIRGEVTTPYELPQPRQIRTTTTGEVEKLDPKYRVYHAPRFRPGYIFKVVWSEPKGQLDSVKNDQSPKSARDGAAYSNMRRSVVGSWNESARHVGLNLSDSQTSDQPGAAKASAVVSSDPGMQVRYTSITRRVSRSKKRAPLHTCDSCQPTKVCPKVPEIGC